ncbi:nuclear transport factor 2 family protein [Emcibacter nanhaiensis]|uniref:Nuclear transport factor 2 family protein n=1 Tax=Emcibacter nanhaiensis TaxID=1505037 RepID=A0A501PIU1_9PROT|nr:nuclear transport factor 2 family protein [Emcibacter nanhaiensis]TPD59854.1 nuclear transport factor 2 family protein [Emcibacter nanhaiensis]
MFDEARYREYLHHFNKPDHETLHREFFAPDVELVTLGNVLRGQEGIRKFYAYFHSCVREHIDLIKFYPTEGGAWVHVAMRLEAFEDLTEQGLANIGIQRMPAIPKGTVYENEMFIHYQLNSEGKLGLLRCAEYIPPMNVIE